MPTRSGMPTPSRGHGTRHVARSGTALHLVKFQRPIDTLPQVVVADRHELAESFPMPSPFAPMGELASQATAHVPATRQKRHARRLVERFEAADHGQQLEPAGAGVRLGVSGRQLLVAGERLQHELPSRPAVATTDRFRVEQKMRAGGVHGGALRSAASERFRIRANSRECPVPSGGQHGDGPRPMQADRLR